jgi:hypothetical protein
MASVGQVAGESEPVGMGGSLPPILPEKETAVVDAYS